MRFASTRSPSIAVPFAQAVLEGFPDDGGLYAPAEEANLRSLVLNLDDSSPWPDTAALCASALFAEDLDPYAASRAAFRLGAFPPAIVDLDDDVSLVDLSGGPSCNFKDYGMSFLAALAEELLEKRNERALVLLATTGDTGAAAAEAFANSPRFDVVLLYPEGRVHGVLSERRRGAGGNVSAISVRGDLAACRGLVRSAYADRLLARRYGLLPATSANAGRLLPQIIYYMAAFAALKRRSPGDFMVAVPAGNLGNLISGLYAWKWGLPVSGFILPDPKPRGAAGGATLDLVDYLFDEGYGAGGPRLLDEDDPENRERIRALAAGAPAVLRSMILPVAAGPEDAARACRLAWEQKGIYLDPGSAAAYAAARRVIDSDGLAGAARVAVLGVDHPGRHAAAVEAACGSRPSLPERLERMLKPFEADATIEADPAALAATLSVLFGA